MEDVGATSLALCPLLHGQLIGKHLGASLVHLAHEVTAATQFESRWQALFVLRVWCAGDRLLVGHGETVSYFSRSLSP